MIELNDVTVSYPVPTGRQVVLTDINLAMESGQTCALIGPSGCGKSTLLKLLAGIINEYQGTVMIDGHSVAPIRQRIGFIPQNYGLLPWRTVQENILLAARIKQGKQNLDMAAFRKLVDELGLAGLEKRFPGELSGGQQQRVALARAFLLQPDLLLMDEPFSALDAMTREDMQQVFLSVWREHTVSAVLVTHQVEEAVYLGRKIIIMSPFPGTIRKIIDNPLFGLENRERHPDFFEFCVFLRQMIQKDWAK
ncbi:MAG: btuD 2 [Firmicutes bacterium]|nr:btuD 2 [Bacillota bacterium]